MSCVADPRKKCSSQSQNAIELVTFQVGNYTWSQNTTLLDLVTHASACCVLLMPWDQFLSWLANFHHRHGPGAPVWGLEHQLQWFLRKSAMVIRCVVKNLIVGTYISSSIRSTWIHSTRRVKSTWDSILSRPISIFSYFNQIIMLNYCTR